MYDRGWFESRSYNTPIICVGNLSTGGTGKSPMVQYISSFLKEKYDVAILSRGYKRKTKGFLEVEVNSTAEEVGDEPLQFKRNFPDITVAVCEDRRDGIEQLQSGANIIVLDDAFQHRRIQASLNILLTPFDDLYIEDHLLPAGNLRESRSGANRADIIVITKCPEKVPYAKLQEIQFRMRLLPHQKIYFSRVGYDDHIYGKSETQPFDYLFNKEFTLVTGIANPAPLVTFLKAKGLNFTHEEFPDHHNFSDAEVQKLKEQDLLLTTEKDFMRLQPRIDKFAFYYLPIKTIILKDQEPFFKEAIINGIN